MSQEQDNPIKSEKRRKLHALKAAGIDPFPHEYQRNSTVGEIRARHGGLKAGEHTSEPVYRIAGRVMTVRIMGKAAFFNLQDQSGILQVYLKTAELSEKDRIVFDHLDLGDIVGVEGTMFGTKTGELTLNAKSITMLCKTLEPLPDKHSGLADVELKYRARYLDLLSSPESRQVFEIRSKVIREIRNFLDSRGFLEVEVPMLQPIYGGAAAHPFKTHHRALDLALYLKISPELYLKRLIVGGFEKVYDLSKNFRNEGIDRSHNPEFMMLEWYEAYTDYNYQMKQFEELVSQVAMKVVGKTRVPYQGQEINLAPPWKRISMIQAIQEFGGLDVSRLNDKELFAKAKAAGSDLETAPSRGELICELFELLAEKKIVQPTFIIDHPEEISPLTKGHRQTKGLVERFEPIICGMEVGNAYTELNDPEEQRSRLESQDKKRVIDDEAHPMDEDFVRAIEVGMPPTGGVGLGIERLVMLLTDQHSIRDTILFPTMRPRSN
ncbi:MAG: lysine--tRNA ligase [Oligoflexia bacterium]|nr:lysine--tRNA ligase [Oligoflexia bacterium]